MTNCAPMVRSVCCRLAIGMEASYQTWYRWHVDRHHRIDWWKSGQAVINCDLGFGVAKIRLVERRSIGVWELGQPPNFRLREDRNLNTAKGWHPGSEKRSVYATSKCRLWTALSKRHSLGANLEVRGHGLGPVDWEPNVRGNAEPDFDGCWESKR